MSDPGPDALILGCVSEKNHGPSPAKDLYLSPLFQKRRRYAEAAGLPWVIFSAEHGIVEPDTVLNWYDVALKDLPPRERRAKGEQAVQQLEQIFGSLTGMTQIHAGASYREALEAPLARRGASLTNRIEGLRFGEQLQWYDLMAGGTTTSGRARRVPPVSAPRPTLPRAIREIALRSTRPTGSFSWRWPDAIEHFERGWDMEVAAGGSLIRVRHAIGSRPAYGRTRVHSVTWVGGQPTVEGVEADNFEDTGALISVLKIGGRKHVRSRSEIPAGYEGFPIVRHDDEIRAPYSRRSLAVKIAADDLAGWSRHALLRAWSKQADQAVTSRKPTISAPPVAMPALPIPPPVAFDREAVVDALLDFGSKPTAEPTAEPQFTPDPEANRLVIDDPFAFLLAVIFDQGVVAERAWAAPSELRRRLGHLDPKQMADDLPAIVGAVQAIPKLHRYIEKMPRWLHAAAVRVVDQYEGDAGRIWGDKPTAVELQVRLDAFAGVGQKKAAMAVEILERDLGVTIRELKGSDIA